MLIKDKQLKEALERMELLKLEESVIEALKKGNLYKSETLRNPGALSKVDKVDKDFIDNWAKEIKYLPYHVIKESTLFGDMLTILYVSNRENEWEEDREGLEPLSELEPAEIKVYSVIKHDRSHSGFANVNIRPFLGGLCKVF